MTGYDGMVNIEVLCGGSQSVWTSVVVVRGSALRIPIGVINREFDINRNFRHAALAYLRFLMFQVSQSGVCHLHHTIEQELCCWLLMIQDRAQRTVIRVTHQTAAEQLRVEEKTIAAAVRSIENSGAIISDQGEVTIAKRSDLEERACECYGKVALERNGLRPKGPQIFREESGDR